MVAEDSSDLERTEPASPKRLEQAREEGQVPQSRELAAFLVMMAGAAGIWAMGGWLSQRVGGMMSHGLTQPREAAFAADAMGAALLTLSVDALLTIAPLLLLLLIAALATPFLLGGFNFSAQAFNADFSRLALIKGLGRMFSLHGLTELFKAIAKAVLVGVVAWWVLADQRDALFAMFTQETQAGIAAFAHIVLLSTLLIVGAMGLIAAIDVPLQLWQYQRKLRMTKEELRKEAREQEGDPQLKARIRAQQREMARKRMMAEVPRADVIVTNPTHYAVALKYDSAKMRAPRVVAKGAGLIAARIREIAAEAGVPLLSAPPLARALHRHTEPGDEVPSQLYTAVAEVMAYIYQLNRYMVQGGAQPQAPVDLPVPPDMDPEANPAAHSSTQPQAAA